MLHLARYSSIRPSDLEKALGITVGFDSIFDRLFDDYDRNSNNSGFPPYNIRKEQDDLYTIEMAVAGFSKEDLEAELKDCVLTVRSKTEKDEVRNRSSTAPRKPAESPTLLLCRSLREV